jgi:hypothetical protein
MPARTKIPGGRFAIRPSFFSATPHLETDWSINISGEGHKSENVNICVGTFNVDNIKSNAHYVNELLKTCDILCLQEHWLYCFEKPLLQHIVPDYKVTVKCSDEEDPIPPSHKPGRGHAGVAVIWNSDVNKYVFPLLTGSERLIALEIKNCNMLSKPIIVINTYMPAGNIRADIVKYQAVLDEVFELLETYSPSHDILWVGDLNGAFSRPKPHMRDQLLREFCREIDFGMHGDTLTPTFNNAQSVNAFRICPMSYSQILLHLELPTHGSGAVRLRMSLP